MKSEYYLKCLVNGKRFEGFVDPDLRLIDFIRQILGLKGTKEGCGQGECGSCMVFVDGVLVNSCLMLAFQCDGKEIITIEGADSIKWAGVIKKMLKREGAVQCGFCTPAIILACADLFNRKKKISEDDIKNHLVGNICRCSGYESIVKAVKGAFDEISSKGKKY